MSSIRPIDFAKVYIQESREEGSVGKQTYKLVDKMHTTTQVSHELTMSPSPIKHITDAGAKGTQVKIVLEEMANASKEALDPNPPKIIASAVKRLNII